MFKKSLQRATAALFPDSQSGIVKVMILPASNKALSFILELNDKIIVVMSLDLHIADIRWNAVHKVCGDVLHRLQPCVEWIKFVSSFISLIFFLDGTCIMPQGP
jgi:hypothetical protein